MTNMIKLDNNVLGMLIGCLLGDAHIGISGGNKAFITFEQTTKHEGYVKHIYQTLQNAGIGLHDIKYYSRKDSRYNSVTGSIYFKTHNSELLFPLASMFLSNGNKILPLNIEQYLSPIALAYWICDDGQLVKRGGITLCTDNYTLAEVELLIQGLANLYNAKCSIHYKKGRAGRMYHRIYIGKNSFDNIKPLISQYIYSSFLYKLHE